MKKNLSILFFGIAAAACAQNSKPVFIADHAILGTALLHKITPDEISAMSVWKSENDLPDSMRAYAPFLKNGIVDINFKHKSEEKIVTAKELNTQHNLPENNEIIINGIKTKPNTISIFQQAIASQSIIKNNGVSLLNIETAEEEYKPKPGEKLIR